jgi:hypothetical protein
MTSKAIPLFLGLIAMVSGCSTVQPGQYHASTSLQSLKTAYVVTRPDYDPKIGENIQEALSKHGVTTQTGPLQAKPKDVAFYVEYEDHWRWDLAMYLFSLDVRFVDNGSAQVIGTGAFRQGLFHDFPNPREKTLAVVESIYNAK